MIAHVFLCVLCELRESLRLHFVRLCPRYAANSVGGLGGQAGQATGLCPRMTAFVRLWPLELAKTSSALGGSRALFVRRWPARGSCPTGARPAPRCSTVGYSTSFRERHGPPRTLSAEACFRASPPLPQSLPGIRGLRGERRGLHPGVQG